MSQSQRILVEGNNGGTQWTASYIASGWTVDQLGFLHIFGDGDGSARSIACYAPNHWGFVSRPVLDGETNEYEGQANVR